MYLEIRDRFIGFNHITILFPLLLLTFLILPFSLNADEFTDEAQRLIDANQAADAYQLLIAELEQRAGTPEYDILLGIAALEVNRPTEAVMAFERVLAIDPDNSRARLELARAYFELGENEASREEFSYARTQEVPEEVSASIEEYLTAIDSRIRAATLQRRINFYLQARLGYDANVNSATDSSTVALPAFGNLVFTLDDTARSLESGFYRLEGGASFSSRISPGLPLAVFGGAKIFYRPTWEEHRFDTAAGDAQLGLRYTKDNNAFLASLQGQKYLVDDDTNRNQGGINLQWLHMASSRTQLSVFAQGLVQRFPGQTIRNVNQYSGGVGFVHLLPTNGSPVVYGSLYAGIDDELADNRPDFGRTYFGVRGGGEYTLREDLKLIGSASYQYSKYGGDDPLFQETRKDNFIFLRSGLEYSYSENWVISPEVRYLLNDSNLLINDFNRWQVFATARYNF
jgi:outer membrane protein